MAETLKWPIGLSRKVHKAKGFYAILSISTLLGVVLIFTPVDPMKALFWSAVINGVVAVPVMVIMMLLTSNPDVTGSLKLPMLQSITGWIATVVMFAVAVGMFATWRS